MVLDNNSINNIMVQLAGFPKIQGDCLKILENQQFSTSTTYNYDDPRLTPS